MPQTLGKWWRTNEPQQGWYIVQEIPRLYNWDGRAWTFHIHIPRQTRYHIFQRGRESLGQELQWEGWDRATVLCTQHSVKVTGTGQQTQKPEKPDNHWTKYLLLTQHAKKWILKITRPDTTILKEATRTGEAWAVSGRSFSQGARAAAWTIEGWNQEGQCTGTSFTPGDECNQSALRSELAGIYGIIYTLKYMTALWEEEELYLKIVCDGKLAVERFKFGKIDQTNGSPL